ncbi:DUF2927 domain-containing protein [Shewanella submarina]|uniref:DUF2927 domain-containing protein n=1 Tax=Shewanella submarina TaxID=2016376 RepID=A0ABV7GDZ4_9GAMM|nr:DUF2927 domain-containing protein [Shewanella submarina]MCL1037841.1 DUF2927 domain-containing protein [Shewanella submarina]
MKPEADRLKDNLARAYPADSGAAQAVSCHSSGAYHLLGYLAAGLLLIMLAMPVSAEWSDNAYVSKAFNLIALNNEYDDHEYPVRKWHRPIRVWLDHRVGDEELHTKLVQMQMMHLGDITGHDIGMADSEQSANVRVLFTRQATWQAETRELIGPSGGSLPFYGTVCMGHLWMTRQSEIRHALIVIPVDQARMHGKLLSCVVEEFSQAMGLPNDSEQVFPSIFNDASKNNLLTPLDVTLLRLLYLPEISAGMEGSKVMPLLRSWLESNPDWSQQAVELSLSSAFRRELGLN